MFVDAHWAEPAAMSSVITFACFFGGLAQLVAGTLEVWMLHTMHSFFNSVTLQADPPISALRGAVTAHANAAYQGQQLCRHGILQVCFWRATQALPETSSYPP